MADPGAADAAEGATAANKDLWTRINAEYTDEQALRSWAAEDISWGVFNVPEAELDVLGDVADLDVVDLGGGTAYLSAWLARRGARPVGVDLTAAQLDTARRCQARFGISFPLIEADAAQVPLPGASFDLAVSEFGASLWCAPDRWVPEAARLLRPGGRLVFHTTTVLVTMCLPEGPGYAGRELLHPQRDVARMRTPDGGVEFHSSHGEWIAVLRRSGFAIDALHELYAPPDAQDHPYYDLATAHWARKWPVEEVWGGSPAGLTSRECIPGWCYAPKRRHRLRIRDVPGRPDRLRRRVRGGRRRAELRHAGGGAGLPGRVRRPARAGGAVAAGRDVQRSGRARPGVRRVRRRRRGGRRGGAAAGRRADRVPVLAVVCVREPALRRPGRCGRGSPAAPPPRAGPAEDGPARRGAGLGRHVLYRLRFSNAALHSWHTPSTWGFLAAGVVLLVLFGGRQARAPQPLLPPRVVTDRNRGGAYLTMLIASAGTFGIFLFLTYYLQQTLEFSPVVTGLAFLPMVAGIMTASITSNIVLMPRFGPRPLAPTGMILAAGGLALLTRIGVHSSYAGGVLPSLLMMGLGLVFAPVFNTGTFGVPPQDAGVAAATVNTGQQLGGSVGTSLLNTIFASSVASYIRPRPSQPAGGRAGADPRLQHRFWWSAAILAGGAIVAVMLFRSGPLARPGQPRQFQPSPDATPVPDAGRPLA